MSKVELIATWTGNLNFQLTSTSPPEVDMTLENGKIKSHRQAPDDDRFFETSDSVTLTNGTYYPGCTEEHLADYKHATITAPLRFPLGTLRSTNLDDVALDLVKYLSFPPPLHFLPIISNLRTAINYECYTPDLPIKCFADLDAVYFNSTLANRIELSWLTHPKELEAKMGPDYKKFNGLTLEVGCLWCPTAKIWLNAECIFENDQFTAKRRVMWGCLLHEMVHDKFGPFPLSP
ncbi:MAG: hypothetical protein MMC33_004452 [Icmadophila ericetorum]|nr:hypothetical protein [Icmadophila ericetorum]